jgi:hypothetical protein
MKRASTAGGSPRRAARVKIAKRRTFEMFPMRQSPRLPFLKFVRFQKWDNPRDNSARLVCNPGGMDLDLTGQNYFFVKVNPPFPVETRIRSPGLNSPSSSLMERGLSNCSWMARLSGRAPNCGS